MAFKKGVITDYNYLHHIHWDDPARMIKRDFWAKVQKVPSVTWKKKSHGRVESEDLQNEEILPLGFQTPCEEVDHQLHFPCFGCGDVDSTSFNSTQALGFGSAARNSEGCHLEDGWMEGWMDGRMRGMVRWKDGNNLSNLCKTLVMFYFILIGLLGILILANFNPYSCLTWLGRIIPCVQQKTRALVTAQLDSSKLKLEMMKNFPYFTKHDENNSLAILCDLFGMVKWPFQRLPDLQLGDKKVNFVESPGPQLTKIHQHLTSSHPSQPIPSPSDSDIRSPIQPFKIL